MYRRHALNLIEGVRRAYPKVEGRVQVASAKGSFEIELQVSANEPPQVIWSGLKRGPPRRLKFPELEQVLKALQPHL